MLIEELDVRRLVDRATAHDPDAWEMIFRRSHGPLYSFAVRRTASSQAAEDAVSETMMRALERIGRFTWRDGGFDAWLFGIMRNVVLEGYRRDARTRKDRTFRPEIAPSDEPLDALLGDEEATAVRAAFARLDDDEQEVLELRVVAGLSSDDVGRRRRQAGRSRENGPDPSTDPTARTSRGGGPWTTMTSSCWPNSGGHSPHHPQGRANTTSTGSASVLRCRRPPARCPLALSAGPAIVAWAAVAAGLVLAFVVGARLGDDGNDRAAGVAEFSSTLELDGSGIITVEGRKLGIGRTVAIRTSDLPILPVGDFYEVWFLAPGDTPDDTEPRLGRHVPSRRGRQHRCDAHRCCRPDQVPGHRHHGRARRRRPGVERQRGGPRHPRTRLDEFGVDRLVRRGVAGR